MLGTALMTSTAAELNLLDGVSGLVQADFTKLAAVDASAAEINLLDKDTAIGSSAGIVDADGIILHNANGAMEKIPASDLITYLAGSVSKAASTLTAVLAAGDPWDGSRADMANPPGTNFISNDGGDTELYVNGQLLLKGANDSEGDYYQDSGELKFAFGLEIDDVIQMINRV